MVKVAQFTSDYVALNLNNVFNNIAQQLLILQLICRQTQEIGIDSKPGSQRSAGF